jgi:pimeloyl-ACP methyl ester carboxylesterase
MPPDDVTRDAEPIPPGSDEPLPLQPAPVEPLPFIGPAYVPPPPPASRATRGGTRLRWILFLIGVGGLGLGAIGIRSVALFGERIDPDLVTTPELASMSTLAIAAQAVILILTPIAVLAGRRWSRRMRTALHGLGDPGPLLAPARATSRLALSLATGGVALVAIGAIGLVSPLGRDVARLSWALTAVGALTLPVAAGLLLWVIGDSERREALLLHADDPRQPHPGDRDRRWPMAAMALLAVLAVIPPAANIPSLWSDHVCHAADLECRWVIVQADQIANDPRGPTTVLHYGLRRADKQSLGTLVIATGGPGVSGVSSYAESGGRFDPRLTDAYDIVVFDARGVGESSYVDCPVANSRYQSSLWFDVAPAVIDDFVKACVDESGVDRSRLAEYSSAQLAEDVETIRRDLGVERIALYGESYGTVVAQRYAVAHPDHLEALILDGAIDIDQPTDASWIEAAGGFEDVLERSLRACAETRACDFAYQSVWANVMGSLDRDGVSASYAGTDGVVTDWPLFTPLVREVLINAMYDVTARMLALRALSAAEGGDWVPMARLVYAGFDLSPGAVSDFAYYATGCADRHATGPEPDTRAFLQALKGSRLPETRTGSVYLSSAACHAWPLPAATSPPISLPASAPFPVLILSATADPITPASHGRRIADRYRPLTETYILETSDGPHVTFGRGNACPDDAVIDLLLDDIRPSEPVTSCPGELVAPYLELAVEEAEDDPLSYRGRALDLELLAHPDYRSWDGIGALTIGCRFGGRIEVEAETEAMAEAEAGSLGPTERVTVSACAIVKGEPMTGTGTYRGTDEAEFEVRFPGGDLTYRIVGEARYTDEEDTSASWSGVYLGRSIDGGR